MDRMVQTEGGAKVTLRRVELRNGARLPLSCVSWPAVKSFSLPVDAGSPQGAIVPDPERETGTDRERWTEL